MDAAERWTLIAETFTRALELDPGARDAWLYTSLGSFPDLRLEVARLLSAHDAAGGFLSGLDRERSAALIASAADDAEDEVPARLGRYRIVRPLGAGGMGVVYLAHDPELDRPIALKLLRSGRIGPPARARLLHEARAASALDHPNVAAIHEIGETAEGRAFIAMAYCEGESLADRVAAGPLPAEEAARIALQVSDALAAAHALGIVHRDVKPANVIVSGDGRARLMDFGVAIAAESAGAAVLAGTPGYLSPEQLDGAPAGPASDVWSLGVLLHELLTGSRPGPDAPASPGPLGRLAAACRAQEPAARPTAGEVGDGLRAFLHRSPARRTVRVAAALALLAVLLVSGWLVRGGREATSAEAALLVLPFRAPAPGDAAAELAHQVAVMLSDALGGVTTMPVADPLLALADPAFGRGADEDRLRRARRAGFATVVLGRLVQSDSLVRAIVSVHDTRDGRVLGTGSTFAPAHPAALADSLALALLRSRWFADREPTLAMAARGTSSMAALRAFVAGERAVAGARFRLAPELFARAIEADSAFGLAYWRYWFARGYHGSPVDSSVIAAVLARRASFPEPDRLLVEARMAGNERDRLARLRTVTTRHPAYWPGWFELGDHLTHHGAFLGVQLHEARAALRRVAELNPGFVPAWEHLLWTALLERDTAESAAALARLEALRIDTLARREWDLRPVDYYRYLVHLVRTGGEPRSEDTEIGADVLSGTAGASDPERTSATLLLYGFPRAQLVLSQRILQRNPPARIATAHTWGMALAWAARGGWDSAFANARSFARATPHPRGALWAFALVATGAWLGELHPDSARLLAPFAERSAHGRTPAGRAELAWLHGILACRTGDRAALAERQQELQRSTAPSASALATALAAFGTAFDGDAAQPAEELAALELDNAAAAWQFAHGPDHPFASGLHRIAAAQGLLQAGDTAAAAALLLLHETDLPNTLHPLAPAQVVLSPYSLRLLARIEEARGNREEARRHRGMLTERADLAPDAAPPRSWCGAP
jgi:hypothetical protein